MNLPKITQENVHVFIPYKVAHVATHIMKDENITVEEALGKFYNSKTYEILEIEETKMWYESPKYLYEDYIQRNGG